MTTFPHIAMLDLKRLHEPLASELRAAFETTLSRGRFIGGDILQAFEAALCDYLGAGHCIGVSSGTDALLASLLALGVRPGDEIITTTYSFFATAGSIARLSARPVFVDIDPCTFNIDPALIERAITPRTVGIVPVHLFGQCADMPPILASAEKRGLFVIEDAAQSIGATCCDRFAGTLGNAGAVSFFPAKNLGALGDGGAVITHDNRLADALRCLRQHGSNDRSVYRVVGGNFRLDALQAAFLKVKLPYLEQWQQGRKRVAAAYRERLSDEETIVLPTVLQNNVSVHNQFVIRCKYRSVLQNALRGAGIDSAVYYPLPLHLQPCFASLGYREGDLPVSEGAAGETLALPMDPLLTETQIDRICGVITSVARSRSKRSGPVD